MLAIKNRLKKAKDFKAVKDYGQVYQSDNFWVSFRNRKDVEVPRFGFIISTKISKMAIHRNRVKRALSEGVRHSLTEAPKGFDVVFFVKKTIVRKVSDEIMKEAESALRKINFR